MEASDIQVQDQRRAERRLARGLEDVSHLFLSQAPPVAVEKKEETGSPESTPAPSCSEPTQGRAPILLHASSAVDKESLIALLHKNAAILEEGMHAIDVSIPCEPFGSVDILALDRLDQMVIMDVEIEPQDQLLLRGIAQFDWFERNTPILRRMYHGRVVNFSAPPRIFLIAPDFSPLLKCVAQRGTSPLVFCFGFRTVALPGGVGMFFERR